MSSKWREHAVDRTTDHFEIRFGEASTGGPDEWVFAALLSRAGDEVFNVEFLLDRSDSRNSDILKSVVKELDFYLVETPEADPWAYAKYHCGTCANLFSKVHWSFIAKGSPPSLHRT